MITKNMKKIYHSKCFPRLFYIKNDGGDSSGVKAFFLIEWKILFSVGLLRFNKGSREAYHSHAFNAISWWLKGHVTEIDYPDDQNRDFKQSWRPKITLRDKFHKVYAHEDTWAITLRGPWFDIWKEFRPSLGKIVKLTHGRRLVD